MNIENTLLQMLFGAMAGYITNDLALEMLFEKRFGLGGVIPRTKQQFIDNISELAERDIITRTVITDEMEKPEFDMAVSRATRDFFDEAMPEKIESICLSDMPGFDDIAKHIAAYADRNMDTFVEQLIVVTDRQVRPHEILGEEQIRFAVERIFSQMLQAVEEQTIIENYVKERANEIQEKHIVAIHRWVMNFIDENRPQLEQMVGRAMTNGLSQMGPMMAILAGGLSFVTGSIQAEAVDIIAEPSRIRDFLESKLGEVSRGDSAIPEEIKNAAVNLLKEERRAIIEKAEESIAKAVDSMSVREVAEAFAFKELLRSAVSPETIKALAKKINLHKTYTQFVYQTEAAERMKENAGEEVGRYIKQNANRALSGKIKEFVANNLNRYSENEIKETARGFIGRNLKPITYFGGFLGMITGFFLSLAMPEGSAQSAGSVLIYMATYGAVGWATNWIAIGMLFRPYRKYAVIPYFSPGYVVKNKTAFGESLGIFIETEVLSGEIITKWFRGKKDAIKDKIADKIAEDQYALVRNMITDGGDRLASYIADLERKWLAENQTMLASQIASLAGDLSVKSLVTSNQKQIAAAAYRAWNSEHNQETIIRAADTVIDKMAERIFDELDKPENIGKIADYLCDNVELLQNIPFIPQAMVRQILYDMIDAFITEELPLFWASKSSEARDALLGSIDDDVMEQTVIYAGSHLKNQKVEDYLIKRTLKNNIAEQIEKVAESEIFLQSEIRTVSMILADLSKEETFAASKDFLRYGTEIVAVSMVDVAERNIGEALRSVNFAQITKEQVMKLDGREIHIMFNSFMHKYFISIRRYGLMGSAFGIHAIVGTILMSAYWMWCFVRRVKK